MNKLLVPVLLGGLVLAGIAMTEQSLDASPGPKTVKIGKVTFYTDYDAALKLAKKQKKPLWLHFGENPG